MVTASGNNSRVLPYFGGHVKISVPAINVVKPMLVTSPYELIININK